MAASVDAPKTSAELTEAMTRDERRIRELERENEELRAGYDHYKELFESSPIGIYRTTPGGDILLANASLCKMMGFETPEELAARNLEQEGYRNIEYRRCFKRYMEEDGSVQGFETAWLKKDGEEIFIRENARAVRDEEGVISYYEGTIENVSERVRIDRELQASLAKLSKTFGEVVEALAMTVEKRDPYTAGHQTRVAALAVAMARYLGAPPEFVHAVKMAATMHDVGKIYVPAEILSRPGRLTREEMDLIRLHSTVGADILANISFERPIATIVRQHHEKLDGTGYPDGLSGDEILPEARIITVADMMEALSSHRPYRPAFGVDVALTELERQRGNKLDPDAVNACLELFTAHGYTFPESQRYSGSPAYPSDPPMPSMAPRR